MPEITESVVVQRMREYQKALVARDAETIYQMGSQWLLLEEALEANIRLLAMEIAEMGVDVDIATIYRHRRYQKLLAQTQAELTNYNIWAANYIAENQKKMAVLGIEHATDALNLILLEGGSMAFFDRIPVSALQLMVGNAGKGGPVYALLESVYPEAVERMTRALIQNIALGIGPGATARQMMNGIAGSLDHALTVARTEQLRVYREASRQQYEASGAVKGYKRFASKSGNTCALCLALDGEIYPTSDLMSVHPNDRCVIGGTLVSGARPEIFSSRDYTGDVVSIRTASGNLLTVTPNHPVLTDRGWIAAELIQEGDNVVRSTLSEQAAAVINPNDYQAESLVENIPLTLGMGLFREMPVSAEDFHGDGRGSQVYTKWANSHLRDNFDSSINQPFSKNYFRGGNIGRIQLPGLGNFTAMFKSLLDAFSRPQLLSSFVSLFSSHIPAYNTIGLGLASEYDPNLGQCAMHQGTCHTELRSQSVFRNARFIQFSSFLNETPVRSPSFPSLKSSNLLSVVGGTQKPQSLKFIRKALRASVDYSGGTLNALAINIEFDSVIEVGVRAFSGHVYNLHNKAEWYTANGIITHNCVMIPLVRGASEPTWESGADWLTRQDPELQQKILGKGAYELWDKGDIELMDLVKKTEHEIWGPSLKQVPLRDLATAA